MGYGTVRPHLGDNAKRVVAFGVIYCLLSGVLDVLKAMDLQDNQKLTEVSGSLLWLVIVPVAILDAFFYLWTFMSLYDVVAYLEERRQTVKLNLFRRFIWVLATCLFFSTVWVCYQLYRFAEEIRWYNSDT